MMNIFLLGMMLAGKSTIGKLLADKLSYDFIDTDNLIETKIGMKITDYFNIFGETSFRQLEKEVLHSLNLASDTVIATGGGIVLDPKNVAYMKRKGIIIYLEVDESTILKRINTKELAFRPLLKNDNTIYTIRNLLNSRRPLYENCSDIKINCINKDINEIVNEIISIIYNKNL